MSRWIATLVIFFSGQCLGQESPFLGSWESLVTESEVLIESDGTCKYYESRYSGKICEWRELGATEDGSPHGLITIKTGSSFIEIEMTRVKDSIGVWGATTDIFKKKD